MNYDGFYNDECHRDLITTHFDERHPGSCCSFAVAWNKMQSLRLASEGMCFNSVIIVCEIKMNFVSFHWINIGFEVNPTDLVQNCSSKMKVMFRCSFAFWRHLIVHFVCGLRLRLELTSWNRFPAIGKKQRVMERLELFRSVSVWCLYSRLVIKDGKQPPLYQ